MSDQPSAGDRWLRQRVRPRGVIGQTARTTPTASERTGDAVRQAVQRLRRRQQLPDE